MHLRRRRVGFKREHSTRASTSHSPVWGVGPRRKRLTKAVAAHGWGPVGHPGGDHHKGWEAVKDIYQPLDFEAELCLQIAAICLRSAQTADVPLQRLRSRNADVVHQFWALMKEQEQWPDLLSKTLSELYLKLSFKQHLSNPSVQKYFILLWELYIFPSSKRYKI